MAQEASFHRVISSVITPDRKLQGISLYDTSYYLLFLSNLTHW